MIFRFLQSILDKHEKNVRLKMWKTIYKTVDKSHDVEIGGWNCDKSPFGVCAYDLNEDPACDNCIYCGEPDERK